MNNDKTGDQVQPQITTVTPAVLGPNKEAIRPALQVVPEISHVGPEIKHEIDQESANLGVKEIQENRPELNTAHKEIGINYSGETHPAPTGPTGLVKIPQVKGVENSSNWLSKIFEKENRKRLLKSIGF